MKNLYKNIKLNYLNIFKKHLNIVNYSSNRILKKKNLNKIIVAKKNI